MNIGKISPNHSVAFAKVLFRATQEARPPGKFLQGGSNLARVPLPSGFSINVEIKNFELIFFYMSRRSKSCLMAMENF
jgi:hypothetical protein